MLDLKHVQPRNSKPVRKDDLAPPDRPCRGVRNGPPNQVLGGFPRYFDGPPILGGFPRHAHQNLKLNTPS